VVTTTGLYTWKRTARGGHDNKAKTVPDDHNSHSAYVEIQITAIAKDLDILDTLVT